MKPSCTCEHCQGLCHNLPGWVTPRGLRDLARHLGVEIPSLFHTHLALDAHYTYGEPDVLIPLPYSERAPVGTKYQRPIPSIFDLLERTKEGYQFPTSRCGLLVDGLCSIHDAKPRECRDCYSDQCETADVHGIDVVKSGSIHGRIARAWARPGVQAWLDGHLVAAGLDPDSFREPTPGPLEMMCKLLGID